MKKLGMFEHRAFYSIMTGMYRLKRELKMSKLLQSLLLVMTEDRMYKYYRLSPKGVAYAKYFYSRRYDQILLNESLREFTKLMNDRLMQKANQGFTGWDDLDKFSNEDLNNMIYQKISERNRGKSNEVDIANLMMFSWYRKKELLANDMSEMKKQLMRALHIPDKYFKESDGDTALKALDRIWNNKYPRGQDAVLNEIPYLSDVQMAQLLGKICRKSKVVQLYTRSLNGRLYPLGMFKNTGFKVLKGTIKHPRKLKSLKDNLVNINKMIKSKR